MLPHIDQVHYLAPSDAEYMYPPLNVFLHILGFDYNSTVDGDPESHDRDPFTVSLSRVAPLG